MRLAAILLALALLEIISVPLSAQELTPAQLSAYVAILKQDRAASAEQIDLLRLAIQEQRKAFVEHEAAIDSYWKAWTGLDKQPNDGSQ